MVVLSPTFTAPVDGVLCQHPNTKLFVNNDELGTATLYITESSVIWGGGVTVNGAAAPALSLLYPNICLHGILREPTTALYVVINYKLSLPGLNDTQAGGDEIDEDFEGDNEVNLTDLRFVPQNEADIQPMYSAMCQGQSLNPDPQDEMLDEEDSFMDGEDFEDEDEEFADAEETNNYPDAAAAHLRTLTLESSNSNGHCEENGVDEEEAEN